MLGLPCFMRMSPVWCSCQAVWPSRLRCTPAVLVLPMEARTSVPIPSPCGRWLPSVGMFVPEGLGGARRFEMQHAWKQVSNPCLSGMFVTSLTVLVDAMCSCPSPTRWLPRREEHSHAHGPIREGDFQTEYWGVVVQTKWASSRGRVLHPQDHAQRGGRRLHLHALQHGLRMQGRALLGAAELPAG